MEKVIYTGPIDAYFDYELGTLEYRSVRFETEVLDIPNFQGNAAVNYTDRETPWTRIIEHKWFEFGKDAKGQDLPKTVISREYSSEWKAGDEPYYPVNDEKNGELYKKYKALADKENSVIFGGRLGEYKYYDMDAVIESALAWQRGKYKVDIKILVAAHKNTGCPMTMYMYRFMWGRQGKNLWDIFRIIQEIIFPLRIRITAN